MADTEKRKVMRNVDVKLTKEEVHDFGKESAELDRQIDDKELELKEETERRKGEIKTLQSDMRKKLRLIRQGFETRNVECEEIKDFNRNVVEYYYQGEMVHERVMEPSERQLQLIKDKHEKAQSEAKEAANGSHPTSKQAEVASIIKDETRRTTKHSSVDN